MQLTLAPIRHLVLVAAAAAALPACAPLVVGGAAVGGAMAVDRRSVGVQIEDEAIEQRINNALAGRFGKDQINVNVTAYNRQVLLAAVLDEKSKADAEALARVQQNVGNVFNELEVRPIATLSTRSNDTALSGKVRRARRRAGCAVRHDPRDDRELGGVPHGPRDRCRRRSRRARGLAPVGRGARGQAVRGALSAPSAVSGIALH